MAYNTGNPIGSTSPRDLYDNAENLDQAMNKEGSNWTDRLGRNRKTFQAAENAADAAESAASNAITEIGQQVTDFRGDVQDQINDLLIAGGRIFETVEAGRAEVNDGDYYYVEGSIPSVATEIWRRVDAGNSEHVSDAPSESYVKDSAKNAHRRIQQVAALTSNEGMALVLSDADGKAILEVAPDGSLYLAGMGEGSAVQDVVYTTEGDEDLYRVVGRDDEVALAIDKSAGLRLPGVEGTVQDLLNNPEFVLTGGEQTLRTSLALSRNNDDVLAVAGGDDELVLRIDAEGNLITPSESGGELNITLALAGLQRHLTANSESDKLAKITDSNGGSVAALGRFGELYLTGMDSSSLQHVISYDDHGDNSLVLVDRDDNIVMKVDGDSRLWVAGLKTSVQEAVAGSRPTLGLGGKRRTDDLPSQPNFTEMMAMAGSGATPPLGAFPDRKSVGDSWLGSVSVDQTNRVDLITPYDPNNGVVHPYVSEFYNGFMGWRYIMVITGYTRTNDQEENPFLYGSNDLNSWTLLTGVLQPPPLEVYDYEGAVHGYNSDPFLSFDPRTAELIVGWRQTVNYESGRRDWLLIRRTKNLSVWSDAEFIFGGESGVSDIHVSPSLIFDPENSMWHLYAITSGGSIHRFTSSQLGDWEEVSVEKPQDTYSFRPWHMEVKFIGDRLVAFVYDKDDGPGESNNLFFGITTKGQYDGFVFSETPVLTNTPFGSYKSSFIPHFNGNEVSFTVISTSNKGSPDKNNWWNLYVDHTNATAWSN